MGIFERAMLTVRVKTNVTLDRIEDPVETLAYAEAQQQNLLQTVGRGLIEVATARQRLSRQAERLRRQIPTLEEQARQALAAGREDLARAALERKQVALAEVTDLDRQVEEIAGEERTLTTAHRQLATRADEFRIRRVSTTARYAAASSRVRVNEALAGVSGELAELSLAVGRADEQAEQMQSRAAAIDILIETGALAEPMGGDRIERELRAIAAARAVEEELAAMKRSAES